MPFLRLFIVAALSLTLMACNSAAGAPGETAAPQGATGAATTAPTPEPEPARATTPAAAIPDGLDAEALRNATYRGILEQPVALVDGRYEGEPFVSGGASRPIVTLLPEPIAYGDLDGDGRPDAAVILVSDTGGSGAFVHLAVVRAGDGAPDNAATLLLGDRLQVRSLAVAGDRIVARLLSHAADDPACCPSLEGVREFRLSGAELLDAGD